MSQAEVARTLKRLGPLDKSARQALEGMLHSLVRKLNHAPIMYLKGNETVHDQGAARISRIRRIFGLVGKACTRWSSES